MHSFLIDWQYRGFLKKFVFHIPKDKQTDQILHLNLNEHAEEKDTMETDK